MGLENTSDNYDIMWVAPLQIKPMILAGIDAQIERKKAGEPCGLFFKTNSITDKDVIEKIVEASQAGVDVTLICDNMASIVMRKGWVQAVVVGCDRVAANGDTANKIGTSGVAILARYYGIPFYVLGPTSTIDLNCPDGDSIVIEERNPKEITDMWYASRMAPEGVKAYNPAFDVTPHDLITAIITEKGIAYPPFRLEDFCKNSLRKVLLIPKQSVICCPICGYSN